MSVRIQGLSLDESAGRIKAENVNGGADLRPTIPSAENNSHEINEGDHGAEWDGRTEDDHPVK
ncbi:hypothetical protein ACFY41_12555 [Streptomyces syringium]|uniref:hypothetical protein n=1 Tax=Streptomyces syringium TaxID=76729 RepID=UPI0036A63D3D